MNHNKEIVIVFNDLEGRKCVIDSMNPDFTELINQIVSNLEIDSKLITCETNIKDFDKELFREIIIETIEEIQKSLKQEKKEYDEVKKTLKFDDNVEEYYRKLKKEHETDE